ncbi:MAG TPA: YbjN domain-containing protein [Longimicrobiales bacterium]
MTTREDLESYLVRLGVEHDEIEDGMWVLHPADGPPLVVQALPPVVVLRIKVLELPAEAEDRRMLALYRRLLELNAEDILHGSYGIEGGDIILSDALELETLDFDELRSSYESLLVAASSHLPRLVEFVPAAHEG